MDSQLPIRGVDYTTIFARRMRAMREFYGTTLGLPVHSELGSQWIEYRVGSTLLALTERGLLFDDPAPPVGALSLQLAFRVSPSEVDRCAAVLIERGVTVAVDPADEPCGHRTVYFCDPDGNSLEIYAEP